MLDSNNHLKLSDFGLSTSTPAELEHAQGAAKYPPCAWRALKTMTL